MSRQHEPSRYDEHPLEVRAGIVHAIRPNMWGACGWCMCGCEGHRGEEWVLRRYSTEGVTCPDCITALVLLDRRFGSGANVEAPLEHHAVTAGDQGGLW